MSSPVFSKGVFLSHHMRPIFTLCLGIHCSYYPKKRKGSQYVKDLNIGLQIAALQIIFLIRHFRR